MKKHVPALRPLSCFIVFFLFLSPWIFSKAIVTEVEKIETLGKVWGFLKYHHPEVAKGKHDWDEEFIQMIHVLPTIQTTEDLNWSLISWIGQLGKIKTPPVKIKDTIANRALMWIPESEVLNDSLKQLLAYIQLHRYQGKNAYVKQHFIIGYTSYESEKRYADAKYPVEAIRLLCLMRYWNIINYFYPYTYLTDQPWNEVLTEMIPVFQLAPDTNSYLLALRKLSNKTDDGHNHFSVFNYNKRDAYYWSPIHFTFIEQKVIVTGSKNGNLAWLDTLRKGDIVTHIDGVPINIKIKELSGLMNGSNKGYKDLVLMSHLFAGRSRNCQLQLVRDDSSFTWTMQRYALTDQGNGSRETMVADSLLPGNIGFLNLGSLHPKQVKKAMQRFKNTKGLVIDVRNYPHGTCWEIAKYLNKKRAKFVSLKVPDMKTPGLFRPIAKDYKWLDLCYVGKNNKNNYKGKVVLLADVSSISHAEWTCMALQTAPNVTIIGSQTAGADGNITLIHLPGGYFTSMSSIGVYYPNGSETQRVGIVPDIEVKPTIAGIRSGKDEVLERAMKFLNSK